MEVYEDLLPETKSEKHGGFTWLSNSDDAESQVAGLLTIMGKRRNTTKYVVEEFVCGVPGRAFLLTAVPSETEELRSYSCLIAPHGASLCECRGFMATGHCKHLSSLEALIEAGKL